MPTSDTYLNPSLSSDSNISSIPTDDTDVTLPVSTDTLNLLDISFCSTLSDCFDHIPEAQSSIDMSSLINSTFINDDPHSSKRPRVRSPCPAHSFVETWS